MAGFKLAIKSLLAGTTIGQHYIDERNPFGVSRKGLKSLKGRYEGERCFIIGNGPSLNKMDLSKLANEYSFGVNGIFYKTREVGFKPTFYVVEDRHVMQDNLDEIDGFDAECRFFPTAYRSLIKNRKNTFFFNMNTGYYNSTSRFYKLPRFSLDCSQRVYCAQSVTMINLQLAFYLGFQKVYLIGMDHSYQIPNSALVEGETIVSTEDDPNHFHPEYFGKGKKWHDPHLDRVERSYIYMRIVYDAYEREIVNATKGGNLEIFDRADFDAIFVS